MAKILIIDDSRLIAHVAKGILVRRGHEVLWAQDGLSGSDLAKAEKPDLILLDLIMPRLDGYEVCRRLKADPVTDKIPVIMLTSKAEPGDKVRGLEMGAVDYVTKPFDEGELLARVGIHLRIKELYEVLEFKNRQLQEIANRDGLTGLYNHRYFQEQLAKDFLRAQRYSQPLACVLFDIDHFKNFNDTYGHQTGDVILKSMGDLILGSIRESDLAARYGGEEFALILYYTHKESALEVSERLRRIIAAYDFHNGSEPLHITISAGVASFPHASITDPGKLIAFADKALYMAKKSGRNRVEIC